MTSLSTQQGLESDFFLGLARFVLAVVAVMLVGCAALKPKTPEEIVRERSQARWDALVKGDVKTAYAFFSPGSRAVLPLENYASSIKTGFWKSAVADKVVCESAQVCEAQVTIEYEFRTKRLKTPLRETWIRETANWWYVQK